VPAPPATSTRLPGPARELGPVAEFGVVIRGGRGQIGSGVKIPGGRAEARPGDHGCRLDGIDEHLRGAERVPRIHEQAVTCGTAEDLCERRPSGELRVIGGHDDDVGIFDGVSQSLGRRRGVRVADRHVGQLALEQADQLGGERVALVVGVALEGQAEHSDLAR